MNEPSFTKGPWIADLHRTRRDGGRTYAFVTATGLVPIAAVTLGVEGMPDDEGRANSRLIAAAPDLFAAVADMIRLADMGLEESLYEPEERGNYAAYNRARAALAKALGEEMGMDNKDLGRVPDGTGLSQAEPEDGLGPSGFDPSRDAIPLGSARPSDGAVFTTCGWSLRGPAWVIEGQLDECGLYGWRRTASAPKLFMGTPLFEIARDSDGSPKGGDACGSVEDDSAVPKGIAQ